MCHHEDYKVNWPEKAETMTQRGMKWIKWFLTWKIEIWIVKPPRPC